MKSTEIPQYHELLWPALLAVADLGGSASISELVETVVKRKGPNSARGVWALTDDGVALLTDPKARRCGEAGASADALVGLRH